MVVLAALVQERIGVLNRMTGLCTRRGYNVISVTVSPTAEADVKRITLALDCHEDPHRLERHFLALADILEVQVLAEERRVDRELLLAKVRLGPDGALPAALIALGGRVVGQDGDLAVVEATGESGALRTVLEGPDAPPCIFEAAVTGYASLEVSERRLEIPPHEAEGVRLSHDRASRVRSAHVRSGPMPKLRLPAPRPVGSHSSEEAAFRR